MFFEERKPEGLERFLKTSVHIYLFMFILGIFLFEFKGHDLQRVEHSGKLWQL